jgi:starch synthase (maltosyl-transferring)
MPAPKGSSPPSRIQILDVWPQLDCGRYPVKRTLGRRVEVWADVFRDGHEILRAAVKYRRTGSRAWLQAPMEHSHADRWRGVFEPTALGRWQFVVEAWVDRAASWRDELRRKADAGQRDLSGELAEGALLLGRPSLTVEDGLADTTRDRSEVTRGPTLEVDVDRPRAGVGAWYELFPRSWGGFRGVERILPELARLGFDVVYLPPVHPIGRTNRKGRNNAPVAAPGDPGSPWAIGAEEGGHTAVHPDLGTLEDFDRLVARGAELGVEVALDFAVQCSPDHPWLREHPEWFHHRPDGTLKYAENPPKRYQDIYNVDFACEDWRGLWEALLGVVLFWVERGVRAFRVDNPHTKPLAFWEWLIREVREREPEVVFLSEAFTRPVRMQALAKAGFSQSYTYFTWKTTKWELTEYMLELTRSTMPEYFRPNFFANTPDILHEYLQRGGRPAFEARLVLAATLSPSYGIYSGFESCENVPAHEGSEEYLDSEKYELRRRRLDGPLLPLVRTLNQARRANPALQRLDNVAFLDTAHDEVVAYAKTDPGNAVLVCVNLNPLLRREGLVTVPPELGLPPAFGVVDLLAGTSFTWSTGGNYVALPPGGAHVLRVEERASRTA